MICVTWGASGGGEVHTPTYRNAANITCMDILITEEQFKSTLSIYIVKKKIKRAFNKLNVNHVFVTSVFFKGAKVCLNQAL